MIVAFRIGWIATLAGLAILFFSNLLRLKLGGTVWLGSGLFMGGFVFNLINTIVVIRSPAAKSPELPELLILTFKGDDGDFGTTDFRSKVQEFASKLEEAVCEGGTSEYDGDEFGGGTGSLYFRANKAEELWKEINRAFPKDDLLDSYVAERVSEGGTTKKLRK